LSNHFPGNWRVFTQAFKREFARTGDPELPAKICAAAMRLRKPVPAWVADWLSDALAKRIETEESLDRTLGFMNSRGKGKSLKEKRARQQAYDYMTFSMKLLTENHGWTEAKAAAYTEKMLRSQYHYELSQETILQYWNRTYRKIAKQEPFFDLKPS
jgi:hypothetical protein